jgi:hypothetical protein
MATEEWLALLIVGIILAFTAGMGLGQLLEERDRLERDLKAKRDDILGGWIAEKIPEEKKK